MKAGVFYNAILAGFLEKNLDGYTFAYTKHYVESNFPAISFSFPKSEKTFFSTFLFPFFTEMLSEGSNKEMYCKVLKIDENDDFTLLLKTAHTDTIGAITVKEL